MTIIFKQLESVLALPDKKRFDHFVKVVADRQEVWGLYQGDGLLPLQMMVLRYFHFGQPKTMRSYVQSVNGRVMSHVLLRLQS